MTLPKNPLIETGTVSHAGSVDAADVIRLYREQEGVDISRFFNDQQGVEIFACNETGYRFYFPFELAGDEHFYRELASRIGERGGDYDRDWSADHELARGQIAKGDRVLEIGCNTGKFLTGIKSVAGEIVGLEFNPAAANKAREQGFDVKNLSIETFAEQVPGSFDVVCAFQVLEHVTNVGEFLSGSLAALRPGGKLILSVPNNEPYYQRYSKYEVLNLPPHHMGLWNLDSFKKFAEKRSIKLIHHQLFEKAGLKGEIYLRSKGFGRVKTLRKSHTMWDWIIMLGVSPFALGSALIDQLAGRQNFAFLSVVFEKGGQS